jgi:glucose-6-phosphate 1-epimerase
MQIQPKHATPGMHPHTLDLRPKLCSAAISNTTCMKNLLENHPQVRCVVGHHGLELLQISSPLAQATISLLGAQVLHFQGAGEAPMLWQGVPQSFAPGKALRSGVPICWPWFSNHPEPGYPAHGFARNSVWELQEVLSTADGRLQLTFALPAHNALWPKGLRVEYRVTVGATLERNVSMTLLHLAS